MKKLLALDYGSKRTGLAITDSLQIIASGLDTIETKSLKSFLVNFLKNEEVETIIIGHALRLHGEESSIELEIQKFIEWFGKNFSHIDIQRQDERFTSKMASRTIIESGIGKKKRKDKALVDKVSATLILQSYMERFS